MRKPQENEQVECPEGSRWAPVKVWKGASVNGQTIHYGIIPEHTHSGPYSLPTRCEYAGMVGRVI